MASQKVADRNVTKAVKSIFSSVWQKPRLKTKLLVISESPCSQYCCTTFMAWIYRLTIWQIERHHVLHVGMQRPLWG